MRRRLVGMVGLMLFALCVLSTAAYARHKHPPRPHFTLVEQFSRAPAEGSVVEELTLIPTGAKYCALRQQGFVKNNGPNAAHFGASGKEAEALCPEEPGIVAVGHIKLIAAVQQASAPFALEMVSQVHIRLADWCVYALPRLIVLQTEGFTQSRYERVTAALDEKASADGCSLANEITVQLTLRSANSAEVYAEEFITREP